MRDINQRFDIALREYEVSGPASPERIDAAQKTLGLLFPPSYRLFLSRYGAALGHGFEIAGLPEEPANPDEPPFYLDVVRETVRYRPHALPQDSIFISHDGVEHGYFLTCSSSDAGYEGHVIEWGPSHDGGKRVADDFLTFLEHGHDC
jgi:hypothetical protein